MTEGGRVSVVRVEDTLLVTVQEGLTESMVRRAREDVTAALQSDRVRGVVVDVSGVDTMDSFITRSTRDLAVIARLMGVETVLCGLRPDVAATIVDMGIELTGVPTALSVDHAMRLLRHRQRQRALGTQRRGGGGLGAW